MERQGRLPKPEESRQCLEAVRHNPNVLLVEDKASGQSLLQELKKETLYPVVGYKPDREKTARAHAVTALIEGRRCHLPEWGDWVDDYVGDMSKFPNGPHDDDVDATTQGLLYIREKFGTRDGF